MSVPRVREPALTVSAPGLDRSRRYGGTAGRRNRYPPHPFFRLVTSDATDRGSAAPTRYIRPHPRRRNDRYHHCNSALRTEVAALGRRRSDADIFVEFGLTPVQYFRRLEQILMKKHFLHSLGITPTVSAQHQLICQVRLACHSTKNPLAHDDTRLSTR